MKMTPFTKNPCSVSTSIEQKPQSALPSSSSFQTPNATHLNVRPCQQPSIHQGIAMGQPARNYSHIQPIRQPAPATPSTSNLKLHQPLVNSSNIIPPNPLLRPSTTFPAPAAIRSHFDYPSTLHPHHILLQSLQGPSTHPTPMYPSINSPSPVMSVMPPHPWNVYPPMHHQFHQATHFLHSHIRAQSPTPSEESEFTILDESLIDSEYDISPLIDFNTPSPLVEMVLEAIGVTPYQHLENESRSPETFIEQFETFAELLELNETQKRVIFAKLAYRDEAARFEAIKFDTTYYDMKRNFPSVIRNLKFYHRNMMKMEAAAGRSSLMKRTRKFFGRWFK